jgi:hypothetical protein
MQFQVPQNITMEDRIVGSLTAIQFGILLIGGGIAFYFFQSTNVPHPLNYVIAAGLAIVTLVMALGKFNDQPMYRFAKFIVAFVMRPKIRVWHKKGREIQLVRPNPQGNKNERHLDLKNVSPEDIARLAVVLDSRGKTGTPPKVEHRSMALPEQPKQS